MQNAIQTIPQSIPYEPVSPDVYIRLREFARHLAKAHEADAVSVSIRDAVKPTKTNLLEYLKSWELALRNAYAVFKAAPLKDLPDLSGKLSRAGEWMLDNF